MSGFDFVFALFSLLVGLAVTEVLAGFAKVLKLHAQARAGHRKDVRIGWLVPLLAVLVVLNQMQFFMHAYAIRETLPMTYLTLLGVLIVVGGYYLFSALVFPDEPELWPDFDAYYDQHNRFILIGMFVLNIFVAIASGIYRPPATAAQLAARDGWLGNIAALGVFGGLVLLIILIFVKSRTLNALLLAMIIAMTLGAAVIVPLAGL